MARLTILLLILLPQDPEIDSLLRQLGAETVEERSLAEARLIALGAKAIPALRLAAQKDDPEVRVRARAIVETFDRLEIESRQDDAVRAKLLPPVAEADRLGRDWIRVEGVKVEFQVKPFGKGRVLESTFAADPAVIIDLNVDVEDEAGKPLDVGRCGWCRQGLVFVPGDVPFRPRLRGTRRWSSPYAVDFPDVKADDTRKIGDFTIRVVPSGIEIVAGTPRPEHMYYSSCTKFRIEYKPGARPYGEGVVVRAMPDEPRGPATSWCRCAKGPSRWEEFRPPPVASYVTRPWAGTGLGLKDISRIAFQFNKPIVEPVDAKGPALK